jgi:transcriptional antiterminator RfaH
VSYWAAVQLQPRRAHLALHFLEQAGFQTYSPRVREQRVRRGRKVEVLSALFPGYTFLKIVLQWHAARWAPGVVRLVMDGERPAQVPECVITELRQRERNGIVELQRPPRFKLGDQVKVTSGAFCNQLGLYAGMAGRDRVVVLLRLLGGARVTLKSHAIEPASSPAG